MTVWYHVHVCLTLSLCDFTQSFTCQTMASTACSCHRSLKCAPVLTTSCMYLHDTAHAVSRATTEQQDVAARAAILSAHEGADQTLRAIGLYWTLEQPFCAVGYRCTQQAASPCRCSQNSRCSMQVPARHTTPVNDAPRLPTHL
jgi:hypothetical protein